MGTRSDKGDIKAKRKGTTYVIDAAGKQTPYLRGMMTHGLVQRGLSFEDAYAVAHALRDRLAEREQIQVRELMGLAREELTAMLGPEAAAQLRRPVRRTPELTVTYRGGPPQPFSRGLLATSIYAAGVDLDRAYRLVGRVQQRLRKERVRTLDSMELASRVGEVLERYVDADTAGRYRVLRTMRRLPRPVVVYLAGASGAGKSTLALELAPLLRIYRVNSTDTIRQVMRMVFSSTMLPALHRSSFEQAPAGEVAGLAELTGLDGEDTFERRVLHAFYEQATRVLVGVRAVVERSVAENVNILVEGVHLMPPLVPFADLEGAAFQIPFALTLMDEDAHRDRFLNRGLLGSRRADHYLENFRAIRAVQDHLLHQAENYDVPLLDTSDLRDLVGRGTRLVVDLLQRKVPAVSRWQPRGKQPVPALLTIIDGLPDHPVRALGGRTPLEAAETPTLDRLAQEGRCGLADPVAPGVVPDTAAGSLALFGRSPLALKRGPVEALGAGLELEPGDIALRANFATIDEHGVLVDRRAGRIREQAAELASALDGMTLDPDDAVTVHVRAGTEHRLALVLRGPGLSSSIYGSDPGDGAAPGPPLAPRPIDSNDEAAVRTARLLAVFEQQARQVLVEHPANQRRLDQGELPANTVISRGAGRFHRVGPLEHEGLPLRVTCISGDRTLLGIASWLGADTISTKVMTANLDTDLDAKFAAASSSLRERDLVVLHFKGADIAAHDRRPDLKVEFLERLDGSLAAFLQRMEEKARPFVLAVAADHATLSESGQHAADPVPVLVWRSPAAGAGAEPPDDVGSYSERAVATGSLQRFPLQLLAERLFDDKS